MASLFRAVVSIGMIFGLCAQRIALPADFLRVVEQRNPASNDISGYPRQWQSEGKQVEVQLSYFLDRRRAVGHLGKFQIIENGVPEPSSRSQQPAHDV